MLKTGENVFDRCLSQLPGPGNIALRTVIPASADFICTMLEGIGSCQQCLCQHHYEQPKSSQGDVNRWPRQRLAEGVWSGQNAVAGR